MGIRESARRVEELIAAEAARGVLPAQVMLAGFSQGGAMALQVGLTHPHRLAGILGLSCYLPLPDHVRGEDAKANRQTPIFLGHGTEDDIVPLARGEAGRSALEALGCRGLADVPHGAPGECAGDRGYRGVDREEAGDKGVASGLRAARAHQDGAPAAHPSTAAHPPAS
jgi:dienelactone hydrolase